jgi:predicted metal-dependent hydrolase
VIRAVDYGSHTIDFTLDRRDRATLEITVHPDRTVEVIAPRNATDADISARVRKRAHWILSQQKFFAQFLPRTPPRQWVPGETHLYLGRQYRLRIGEPSDARRVRLLRGFILVDGTDFHDRAGIEEVVTAWYRDHAAIQFRRRLKLCQGRFRGPAELAPASVQLRRMNTRWGSMSASGRLSLNPDLLRAPVDSIDYVITHELCHLEVPNHSRAFYELQASVMPDWESRKLRLERALA